MAYGGGLAMDLDPRRGLGLLTQLTRLRYDTRYVLGNLVQLFALPLLKDLRICMEHADFGLNDWTLELLPPSVTRLRLEGGHGSLEFANGVSFPSSLCTYLGEM
jgi:hypothetical protein